MDAAMAHRERKQLNFSTIVDFSLSKQGIFFITLRHKSTVILIELRWTFSTPENRLKQGIQAYNKPRHRVLLRKSDPATLNMAVDFFIIRWYN